MKPVFSVTLISVLFGLIVAAQGQNLLTNGDFETPATTPSPIPGWTQSGTSQIKEEMEGATSGTQDAAFNIGHDSQGSVLSQSFATTAGHTYLLSFDAGIFGVPTGTLSLQVLVIGSSNQTLASRTVIPPVANTTTPSAVTFRHYQSTFVANSSTTVLQFTDQGTGNLDADTILDTVSVVEIPTQPNLVTNGDFETSPFNTTGMVTGWNVGGNVSDQSDEGATTGTHSAALDVGGDSVGNTLSQTFNTTAGTVYVLDFDAGIFGQPSGNPLQLRVQVTGPGSLLDQTVNPPVTGLDLADFQHYTFTFTAGASMTTLQFSDQGGSNAAADVVVDTVTVAASAAPTTPTPTPSSTPSATPTSTPSATPTPTTTPPRPTPTPKPPRPTPTPKPPRPTPTPKPSPSVSSAISFQVSVSPKKIDEGGTATFTIMLSRTAPSSTVVNYTLGGSAVLGQDYTLSGTTGQVTIPAGQTSATVILTALKDNVAENNEMVTLTLSGPTKGKKFASVMIEKQKTKGKGH
jgi:hypothetical protein